MRDGYIKATFVVDYAPSRADAILDRLRTPASAERQIETFILYVTEVTLSLLQNAKKINVNGDKYLVAAVDLGCLSGSTYLEVDSATIHLAHSSEEKTT